jgi:hypothetical protein
MNIFRVSQVDRGPLVLGLGLNTHPLPAVLGSLVAISDGQSMVPLIRSIYGATILPSAYSQLQVGRAKLQFRIVFMVPEA